MTKKPVLIILALILATGVLLILSRPRKTSPPEVTQSQLVLREDSWYRQGEDIPFTGVLVETYETGERKSRSEIAEGRLEGRSERWYTNGQPQRLEYFHAGVAHGLRTKWHPNGRRLSEVQIIQGQLEGTFRRWYEDGTLHQEILLENGKPEGIARAYYPSGFLRAEARLNHGELISQEFWKDGEQSGIAPAAIARQ
ncbi:MAG: toxin-antitoxin system YwqK family antitoxin [Verrucomicrobiae bacterium]|nr:toxin-antitoxin system YwqK family antitoxin [Verrucomicrobiae bacterium]